MTWHFCLCHRSSKQWQELPADLPKRSCSPSLWGRQGSIAALSYHFPGQLWSGSATLLCCLLVALHGSRKFCYWPANVTSVLCNTVLMVVVQCAHTLHMLSISSLLSWLHVEDDGCLWPPSACVRRCLRMTYFKAGLLSELSQMTAFIFSWTWTPVLFYLRFQLRFTSFISPLGIAHQYFDPWTFLVSIVF